MNPELIPHLRRGNRTIIATFATPNTPEAFYWQERFGPKPTTAELLLRVHELTNPCVASDPPANMPPVLNPY